MDGTEIIPGVWVGNRRAATGPWLEAHKIQSVFNCTKDLPFHPSVRQYRVPVDDNLEPIEIQHMALWAPEIALKILREYRRGPLLIHCHAGMQRSTAACAFFLLALTGRPLAHVMHMIKSKRPIAFHPSANFASAMYAFEAELDQRTFQTGT
jgi:hypothetical protein